MNKTMEKNVCELNFKKKLTGFDTYKCIYLFINLFIYCVCIPVFLLWHFYLAQTIKISGCRAQLSKFI